MHSPILHKYTSLTYLVSPCLVRRERAPACNLWYLPCRALGEDGGIVPRIDDYCFLKGAYSDSVMSKFVSCCKFKGLPSMSLVGSGLAI